jgi:hypothetical protein
MRQSFQEREESRAAQSDRQPRSRPPSFGGTGHWTRTIGVLIPLVIGEVVKDPDQHWRFIHISSVAMALISEAAYPHKVHQERQRWEAEHSR